MAIVALAAAPVRADDDITTIAPVDSTHVFAALHAVCGFCAAPRLVNGAVQDAPSTALPTVATSTGRISIHGSADQRAGLGRLADALEHEGPSPVQLELWPGMHAWIVRVRDQQRVERVYLAGLKLWSSSLVMMNSTLIVLGEPCGRLIVVGDGDAYRIAVAEIQALLEVTEPQR
jgi:hypothetical protein